MPTQFVPVNIKMMNRKKDNTDRQGERQKDIWRQRAAEREKQTDRERARERDRNEEAKGATRQRHKTTNKRTKT
jgi:hypothetical protein